MCFIFMFCVYRYDFPDFCWCTASFLLHLLILHIQCSCSYIETTENSDSGFSPWWTPKALCLSWRAWLCSIALTIYRQGHQSSICQHMLSREMRKQAKHSYWNLIKGWLLEQWQLFVSRITFERVIVQIIRLWDSATGTKLEYFRKLRSLLGKFDTR